MKSQVSFRKWIRASVFFLSLSFLGSQAKGADLWDMSLEDLANIKVVSATRQEASSLSLPFVVTVLTGDDLARWGAENLADGLRIAAGVQIRKSPGDFPQYSAVIRGNAADFLNIRTLFLIDGVPVRNPNAGFDPGWLPLSIIKRVEIVKGPASGLYGANAFGGVINVITKNGSDLGRSEKANLEVGLGLQTQRDVVKNENVGGISGLVNFEKNGDDFDSFASGQYFAQNNSEGVSGGHHYQDLFGKIHTKLSSNVDLTTSALLSFDRNQMALSNTDSPIQNDLSHIRSSAQFKTDDNSTLELTAHYSDFRHFLKYTDSLDDYENKGRVYGLISQYTTRWNQIHSLIVGADFSEERGSLETKELDYSTAPPALKTAGWNPKTQNTYGVYTQYEYSGWAQYLPIAGIRYDTNSEYGSAVSPRLGISYLSSENTTLYASVGSGFRAPVFNETEIQGFGKVGNLHLKPEFTTTYEVGLKSVQNQIQNTISVFKEDISRKIDLESIPASALKTYSNSGLASITGVEIDGAYKPASYLRLFYNTTLLKTENGSGQRMDRVAEQKYVLGSTLLINKTALDLVVTHESEMFFYNSNPAIPSDSEGRVFLPSLTTANLQLKHELTAETFGSIYIDNLTDQTYKESFSPFVTQDGLYLAGRTVGVKFNSRF